MSLAENVRVKGTGWTVYLRVLDGMTECDSTEEPRGRHCGQDRRGSREVTIRREESDSRSRGVVSLCDPGGLGCQRDWEDYQAVDKRQVEEAREPVTLIAMRWWCREAERTRRTRPWVDQWVSSFGFGLAWGSDSIRFDSGLFVCIVGWSKCWLSVWQWDHEDKFEESTLGRGEDAPRGTRRFRRGE